MNASASNLSPAEAARWIADAAGPVGILTHAKPDGDALGSVLALAATLDGLGRTAHAWLVPPVPANLLEAFDDRGADLLTVLDDGFELPRVDRYVVLDTSSWSQLGPMKPTIEQHAGRTLVIDHHQAGELPAAKRWIEPAAAATCELLADVLAEVPGRIDQAHRAIVDQALYVGIATDTGWFRFSNTRPRTHELAATLLARGVDNAALFQRLELNERPQRLLLLARALNGLRLIADRRAALMTLSRDDFEQTGAREDETERIVNEPLQVGRVCVSVLACERPPGGDDDGADDGNGDSGGSAGTRLSFRSKPGPDAIDVAALARLFGGGGHARAAGARTDESLDNVVSRLIDAIERALSDG